MSLENGRLPARGNWAKGKIAASHVRRVKAGTNRRRRNIDRAIERGDETADTRGVPASGWAW